MQEKKFLNLQVNGRNLKKRRFAHFGLQGAFLGKIKEKLKISNFNHRRSYIQKIKYLWALQSAIKGD